MTLSTRLTSSLAVGALATGAVLLPGAFQPAAAAPTPEGSAALTWLAGQLDDANGIFVYDSGFGDFTDYGLSLDADLALVLGGGSAATVDSSLDAIEADLASYVSHPDFGSGAGNSAGAVAKVLLTELAAGRPSTVGGFDLEAQLRATLRPASDARRGGRFDGDHGDFVNGVTQPLGVLALSRTTAGAPAASLAFLLDQQCSNGGFRGDYDVFDPVTFELDEAASTRGCEDPGEAQGDATAFALEALLANRNAPGVAEAIAPAIAFLRLPANAAADNANSAGLSGQALRAAGDTSAADAFAARVAALQIDGGTFADAIALNAATKATASGALTEAQVAGLVRSTAQGVLALGLGSYGPVVAPPASSTTTTTTVATTTSTVGATTSTTARTAAAATGTIPKTGADGRTEAALALLLIGAGSLALGLSQLQSRRRA
jgi:hypothetical protein